MSPNKSKQGRLQKLDKGLRFGGFSAIAIGLAAILSSVGYYTLHWYYLLGGDIDIEKYNNMVTALKLLTLVFFPITAIFYLVIGIHILIYFQKRKYLLEDSQDN
jgi:hypothetical protein